MKILAGRLAGVFLVASCLVLQPIATSHAQTSFDQTKLEAFVDAAVTVDSLAEQWQPLLNGAEDEAQVEELQQQAQADIDRAIEESEGITLDETE